MTKDIGASKGKAKVASTGKAKAVGTRKPDGPKPSPRPESLAHGRWLGDFEPLSPAEKAFVASCANGVVCRLDNGGRPARPTASNLIRADLIRFAVAGGDPQNPIHENGVRLLGAWIEGTLNLDTIATACVLDLIACEVPGGLSMRDSRLRTVNLERSRIGTLLGDRVEIQGSLFLRNGFSTTGMVRLVSARISGDLDCNGGSFSNTDDHGNPVDAAIFADRAVVDGMVTLGHGFSACGQLRFVGARIGGSFECPGGTISNCGKDGRNRGPALSGDSLRVEGSIFLNDGFSALGEVRLLTAKALHLYCSRGSFTGIEGDDPRFQSALNAHGLRLHGSLHLKGTKINGRLTFTQASATAIIDTLESWPTDNFVIDGFTYERLPNAANAKARVEWLRNQRPAHLIQDFRAQPWEQLIKVLRETGHPYEASKVAIEKQRQWRKSWQLPWWHRRRWLSLAYGALAGYGYRPWWTVGWIAGVWLACGLIYAEGSHDGLFGPTSPPIQLSKSLEVCGDGGTPGKIAWTSSQCPLPPEYTSFQPLIYSLDVILPFVDLQQENDWAPITSNEKGHQLFAGHALRALMWFEILFGWLTGVLLAAVAGNLVKKD